MTYDLTELAGAGRDYQRHRAGETEARKRLATLIPEALRGGVPQVEVVKLSGYTRERVRQIARAAGIEG